MGSVVPFLSICSSLVLVDSSFNEVVVAVVEVSREV